MLAALLQKAQDHKEARRPRSPGENAARPRSRVSLAAAALLLTMGRLHRATAEDLAIPALVEAKLSSKVAEYDRGFAQRVREKVVVAIVARPSDPDSTRAASQLQAAFRGLDLIGGLPHEELVIAWKSGAELTEACMRSHAAIVFITPALGNDIEAIAAALESLHVLSVAGELSYVKKGVVLGFDLVSGRPKVVINLAAARTQGLVFRSDLLGLARVIE